MYINRDGDRNKGVCTIPIYITSMYSAPRPGSLSIVAPLQPTWLSVYQILSTGSTLLYIVFLSLGIRIYCSDPGLSYIWREWMIWYSRQVYIASQPPVAAQNPTDNHPRIIHLNHLHLHTHTQHTHIYTYRDKFRNKPGLYNVRKLKSELMYIYMYIL